MDFLQDYWHYHSMYEIPRNYALWSGINLVSAVMNKKVHFCIGDVEVYGTDYVLLVGPQGNKKTTCCDFAADMFRVVCPESNIGASTQSAEDIVKCMSAPDFVRSFTDYRGEMFEVRSYTFFINEFKDFIAYSPTRMLNFLTNIYDRKFFDASTIKRGSEVIINPSINILACENPDQLIQFMKNNIMTGGFSRRVVVVYEPDYAEPKAIPVITVDAAEAWTRVKQRLTEARGIVGRYKFTPEGERIFTLFYNDNHKALAKTVNPMMKGYLSTKDKHMLKACMMLDAVSDKPKLVFDGELLELGMALHQAIEPNMPKLSATAGRNELAASNQKILDILHSAGGIMMEKALKRAVETELNPMEMFSTFRYLEESEQIVKKLMGIPNESGKKVDRWMVLTPERWKAGVKAGDWKES